MVNARWPLPWRPLAGAACRRAECRCRCAPRLDAATTAHLSSVRALSVSLLALVRWGRCRFLSLCLMEKSSTKENSRHSLRQFLTHH